jgi:hypothetical protein
MPPRVVGAGGAALGAVALAGWIVYHRRGGDRSLLRRAARSARASGSALVARARWQ